MRAALKLIAVGFIFILNGCQPSGSSGHAVPEVLESEKYPGGSTTVSIKPRPSLMLPAQNLPVEARPEFHAGKALAHQPWVKAPTITTARDGLGPLYNARTCLFCHINGGRGILPKNEDALLIGAFLRLSIPGSDPIQGVIPEPTYGDQLQSQSISLTHQLRHIESAKLKSDDREVSPEAYVHIGWEFKDFSYPDGSVTELRFPKVRIENLGYGPFHPNTMTSLRNAPPIHGVGLLESIAQEDINKQADPDDLDDNGISGRINLVWDHETKKTVPGRFGLKANKVSVRLQTAAAFANDVGISNPIFPEQSCTEKQTQCKRATTGDDAPQDDGPAVELPESLLSLVVNFTRNLGVPVRRNADDPITLKGRELFYTTGCHQCHRPSYNTSMNTELPHLSEQIIWPYSDLLLHDMGPELADNRPDYLATGSEWRTPPLWSVGLSQQVNGAANFLHDGRARTIEEAILWHGGEAEITKMAFAELEPEKRAALIRFVESL